MERFTIQRKYFVMEVNPFTKELTERFCSSCKEDLDGASRFLLEDGRYAYVPHDSSDDFSSFWIHEDEADIQYGIFSLKIEDALVNKETGKLIYQGGTCSTHNHFFSFRHGQGNYTLCIPCQDEVHVIPCVSDFRIEKDFMIYQVTSCSEYLSAFFYSTKEFFNLGHNDLHGNIFFSSRDARVLVIEKNIIELIACSKCYTRGKFSVVELGEDAYRVFYGFGNHKSEITENYFFFESPETVDEAYILRFDGGCYQKISIESGVGEVYSNAFLRKIGDRKDRWGLYSYKDDKPVLIDSGKLETHHGLSFTLGWHTWSANTKGYLTIPDIPRKSWKFWK